MEIKICENCGAEHDGKFASGRFCSIKCANGFSTKAKRKEINEKISKTMIGPRFDCKCAICNKPFISRRSDAKCCCAKCGQIHGTNNARIKNKNNKDRAYKIAETRKRLFKEGLLNVTGGTMKWLSYKDIKVQGTYELRTCKILDHWKEIDKIKDWEYTNDRFDYIGIDGEKHTYLIDFKVFMNDKSFYYLEVKGRIQDNDICKWEAVKDKLIIWQLEDLIANEKLIRN